MADEAGVDAGGESIAVVAPENTGDNISVSQAARALASARHKPKEPAPVEKPAEVDPVEPTELVDETNAAPPEEATGETQDDAPAEKPLRELPRSWTKDRTEHWNKLDPDTQEFLLEQDRKASAEVRRVQNEAAEKLKGLTAQQQAVEQVRKEYEAKLPALLQSLQDVQAANFADIKTFADVERMANEDPFRKMQWDTHQQKLQAVAWEAQQAEQRNRDEQTRQAQERKQREHSLLVERVPEFSDSKKLEAAQSAARELFIDKGYSDSELASLGSNPLLDDHRFQMIVLDALKFRDVQKAKATVATKPVPPVQRPGTARPPGSVAADQVQALTNRLNNSGDLKDAVALRQAQLNASRRRAS